MALVRSAMFSLFVLSLMACADDSSSAPNSNGSGGTGAATAGSGGSAGTGGATGGAAGLGGSGGLGGSASACPISVPDTYDSADYETNAAAELAIRSQFKAFTGAMSSAESDLSLMPTAAELTSLYEAGDPSIKSITTLYYQEKVAGWISEFEQAAGKTATPGEDPNGPGGQFGESSKYIFSGQGVDLRQGIEKGLFNAAFYNRAVEIAGSENNAASVDRILTLWGGHPTFPGNSEEKDPAINPYPDMWMAQYAERRSPKDTQSSTKPLDPNNPGPYFRALKNLSFAKASAGESACETARNTAIETFFKDWERTNFATVIYYLNDASLKLSTDPPTVSDQAGGLHGFGEVLGFVHGFKSTPSTFRTVTDAQIDELLELLGAPASGPVLAYELITDPLTAITRLQMAQSKVIEIFAFTTDEVETFKVNYLQRLNSYPFAQAMPKRQNQNPAVYTQCLLVFAALFYLAACERSKFYTNKSAPADTSGVAGQAGASGSNSGTSNATRTKLLESLGKCSTSVFTSVANAAELLQNAVDKYAAEKNEANRLVAKQAWMTAIDQWQLAELFQFGPAGPAGAQGTPGGQGLRDAIYSWPLVNRCLVEQTIVSKSYEQSTFTSFSLVNTRGLATTEYLLFYSNNDNACSASSTINTQGTWSSLSAEELITRKSNYAKVLSKDIAARTKSLAELWSPSKGNFETEFKTAGKGSKIYSTQKAALNAATDALYYLDKEVKDLKLGRPLGYNDCASQSCPDALESRYAGRSLNHIKINLQGVEKILLGCNASSDVGFDDLLNSLGLSASSKKISAALDNAKKAANAIDDPTLEIALTSDKDKVVALYEAIRKLMDLVRSELLPALELEIPTRVEGDNDLPPTKVTHSTFKRRFFKRPNNDPYIDATERRRFSVFGAGVSFAFGFCAAQPCASQ